MGICIDISDKETGLHYLRARYYDPTIGRFISEDSEWGKDNDPLSLNLYTYCENEPIMHVDPTGHWAWNQYDNLGAGMYARLWDEGKNILQLNPVSMLMNSYKQWDALLSNKITVTEIYAAGFESLASDYKYVLNSKNNFVSAYLPFKGGASDAQVYGAGYHVAGIIIDLASLGVSVDEIVKVVKSNRIIGSANAFKGIRDLSADFKNGTKLQSHFKDHRADFGFKSANGYLKAARNFISKKSTKTTLSFTSKENFYFRYDYATNEFGMVNQYGGISTYFKPKTGLDYWLEQVEKYKP